MTRGRAGWAAAMVAVVLVVAGGLWVVDGRHTAPTVWPFGQRVVGAWGLTTPEMVASAKRAGVTTALLYGTPPEPSSALGKAFARADIRIISAEISDLVAAYECTRTHTVAPRPSGSRAETYCGDDHGYTEERLYREVRELVRRNVHNPLVAGYWVLDDTPDWDPGSLRPVLDRVSTIVPAGMPKICGFSAGLGSRGRGYWEAGRADNFTPTGCDMVAPYVYADSRAAGDAPLAGIDWDMNDVLPQIMSDLRQRGWSEATTPLVGVAQAFGGRRAKNGAITDPPTPEDMVTQATAYCRAGAVGVAWFAWTITTNYPTAQTPANSPALASGVKAAAEAC